MLQIIIPMAGLGTRFTSYGFKTNKYLLPINIDLQPMIELAITSLAIYESGDKKYFFIINEEEGYNQTLRTLLANICQKYGFKYEIKSVSNLTEGPACTVASIRDILDPESPIIVSNSDQVLENWNFRNFIKTCKLYDGCILTYEPDYPLEIGSTDKHSFVRFGENGRVVECREKIVLSKKALVGVHYFSSASLFFNAYDYIVKQNMRAPNGEFYLSLCYQALIEMGNTVGVHDIQQGESFWPVGEPDDYFKYLYNIGGYKHYISLLANNSVLFSNGVSYIKYTKILKGEVVQNPGLVLLLSGDANINSGSTESRDIKKYETTNSDIYANSDCEIIIIRSEDLSYDNTPKIYNISNYTRGWLIGNFSPAIFKTRQFELGLLTHNKNEKWDYHYHAYMGEINVLLEGNMFINNRQIHKGEIFYIPENQLTCPNFIEDCKILCIKVPSIVGDKVCL